MRRVWAPIGARPIALGHHRFRWLYVTAFVSPATGECFWYVSSGVSKPFFEALLATFAEEAGAGRDRIIVLVLDNAGWHTESNLAVPDGIRLLFLPAYTPNFNPQSTSGRSSTSPSSTSTSPTSKRLRPSSPNDALNSQTIAKP